MSNWAFDLGRITEGDCVIGDHGLGPHEVLKVTRAASTVEEPGDGVRLTHYEFTVRSPARESG